MIPKLSKQQHGFLSNRCIETNLLEFVTFVHEAFEKGLQVDVFYADIKKAFDSVNQPLFMKKLAGFPVANKTLHWMNSYSSNRKQSVKVGLSTSDQFTAHSAIGQGTICGPIMFLIFFDDSDEKQVATRYFNFADDKKIAEMIGSIEDTQKLQGSINRFYEWCNKNDLELNLKKCKIMTFSRKKNPIVANYTINGIPIERVEEMRDLGVIMDTKLSFTSHMEYVKRKADNKLAFVKRECYKTFKLDNAKLLYSSLVRSHLEFASTIWSPFHQTHRDRVESTQKQAVMFMHNDYKNREENNYVLAPYNDRSHELNLMSLARRRVNSSALWIHKIISGKIQSPALRSQLNLNTGIRTLRDPEFIRIKFSRTDYGLNSPLNYACRAFNHAALFIDPTLPFHEFKKRLFKLPDCAFGEMTKLS